MHMNKPRQLMPTLLRHIAIKFAVPTTAANYVRDSGLNVDVRHVRRWLAAGAIFEAGRIRQPRGAPAMLYCCDPAMAAQGMQRWLDEERELRREQLRQRFESHAHLAPEDDSL